MITGGANLVATDQQAPNLNQTEEQKKRAEEERKLREKNDEEEPTRGTVDIIADKFVIWTSDKKGDAPASANADGGQTIMSGEDGTFEVYMEGNVVLRQDQRLVQGNGDQRTFRAPEPITTSRGSGSTA